MYDLEEGLERISAIPGYDPSFVLTYYNNWSTYEEYGWFAVLEKNGDVFLLRGGYFVLSDDNTDQWVLEQVPVEYALSEMEEFDELCD